MMLSNLHTHTIFSDGNHTIEENVISAINKGFVSIGFSDHGFTDFDSTYCIKKENQAPYKDEIFAMREKYRDKIEVYYGYEYDVIGEFTDKENLDYSIGSSHYVKTCDGYKSIDNNFEDYTILLNDYFGGDPNLFAKEYYQALPDLMARLKPDILGHFDLVAKYGAMKEDSPVYRGLATEALISCLESVEMVEVNTGAITRKCRDIFYPAPYFLDELKNHKARFILSSDSHDKENLDASFDYAVEVLKAHGVNSVVVLKQGKFQECGLN